jgi:ribosomal protein S18 acetylase RimI-like enzyme
MVKNDRGLLMRIVRCAGIFSTEEIQVAGELLDSYLSGSSDYIVDVAVNEFGPVGYICYGRTPLTEGTFDLYWIAVDRGRQRAGIGKRLVQSLEERLSTLGVRMVVIETSSRPPYAPAIAFYKKIGCQKVAEVPDFYSMGDNKLIFVKAL